MLRQRLLSPGGRARTQPIWVRALPGGKHPDGAKRPWKITVRRPATPRHPHLPPPLRSATPPRRSTTPPRRATAPLPSLHYSRCYAAHCSLCSLLPRSVQRQVAGITAGISPPLSPHLTLTARLQTSISFSRNDAQWPVRKGWGTEAGVFDTTSAGSALAITTIAGFAHLVNEQRPVNKG